MPHEKSHYSLGYIGLFYFGQMSWASYAHLGARHEPHLPFVNLMILFRNLIWTARHPVLQVAALLSSCSNHNLDNTAAAARRLCVPLPSFPPSLLRCLHALALIDCRPPPPPPPPPENGRISTGGGSGRGGHLMRAKTILYWGDHESRFSKCYY